VPVELPPPRLLVVLGPDAPKGPEIPCPRPPGPRLPEVPTVAPCLFESCRPERATISAPASSSFLTDYACFLRWDGERALELVRPKFESLWDREEDKPLEVGDKGMPGACTRPAAAAAEGGDGKEGGNGGEGEDSTEDIDSIRNRARR
jgi:hypothetical protein